MRLGKKWADKVVIGIMFFLDVCFFLFWWVINKVRRCG